MNHTSSTPSTARGRAREARDHGQGLSRDQWSELRRAVRARDLFACQYCGGPARLIDLVTRPGPATSGNAVACCDRCLALSKRARRWFTNLADKRAWIQSQIDRTAKRRGGGDGQSGPVSPPALVIPDEKPPAVLDHDWDIVRALHLDRLSKHRVRDRFRVSYNEIARAEARVWDALPRRHGEVVVPA